jgi:hypothetical protein
MPPEVLAYLQALGKATGAQGGKTAAKNMTQEERTARAKKAAKVAAENRTAKRLEAERKRAKKPGK